MFNQITDLNGNEWYLISSLWLFLVFFIVVAILLFRMRKSHTTYMSQLPLIKEESENNED